MHLICPQCKSDSIIAGISFITGQYKCAECGYTGSFVIEMDDENYRKFLEENTE